MPSNHPKLDFSWVQILCQDFYTCTGPSPRAPYYDSNTVLPFLSRGMPHPEAASSEVFTVPPPPHPSSAERPRKITSPSSTFLSLSTVRCLALKLHSLCLNSYLRPSSCQQCPFLQVHVTLLHGVLSNCRHGLAPEYLPQQPPPGETDTQSSIPFIIFSQEDLHPFQSSRCSKNSIPLGQISWFTPPRLLHRDSGHKPLLHHICVMLPGHCVSRWSLLPL